MGGLQTRTRVRQQWVLTGLGVLFIFVFGFLIFKSSLPARAPDMLKSALKELEEQESYKLTIREYSPGYRLIFEGEVQNFNDIQGLITTHQLAVRSKNGELYLKPENETEWQNADKLHLEGLKCFINHPAAILRAQSVNHAQFSFDPEIENGPLLFFETDSPDKGFLRLYFPKISAATIGRIRTKVLLADSKPPIKEIEILLTFSDPAQGNLKRIYSLHSTD